MNLLLYHMPPKGQSEAEHVAIKGLAGCLMLLYQAIFMPFLASWQ